MIKTWAEKTYRMVFFMTLESSRSSGFVSDWLQWEQLLFWHELHEREKNRRDELTQAQGLIQEQEGKQKKTSSPSQSQPANQCTRELVYLETKESVCSDMTSSAAH